MDAVLPRSDILSGDAAARAAGLVFSDDGRPGFSRRRAGRGFAYFDDKGARIRNPATLARIRSIVIPPAWTDVWISPSPRGHIQATGRDARGRKQYRYHADWRAHREAVKFGRLAAFGAGLPDLRAAVESHLRRRGLDRRKVLALAVALLDRTLIRIGNAEYARDNESYGLTTLTDEHLQIAGATLRFEFTGKSGKSWSLRLADRRIANVLRKCQELPGVTLLRYVDDKGEPRCIGADDVNAWLREIFGEDFTAKTFRTWGATVLAARELAQAAPATSKTALKRTVAGAIRAVSERIGNTMAVCRASYVHPIIPEAYGSGALHRAAKRRRPVLDEFAESELLVLRLLRDAEAVRSRARRRAEAEALV